MEPNLKSYRKGQGKLTISNNLLLYGRCIVVPGPTTDGDLKADTWWPPGYPEMSTQGKMLSLVALDGCSGKELCGELPYLCTKSCSTTRATDAHTSTWLPMAESCFRIVPSKGIKGVNYIAVVDYFSRYPTGATKHIPFLRFLMTLRYGSLLIGSKCFQWGWRNRKRCLADILSVSLVA